MLNDQFRCIKNRLKGAIMYGPLGKPQSNLNGWDNISDFQCIDAHYLHFLSPVFLTCKLQILKLQLKHTTELAQ